MILVLTVFAILLEVGYSYGSGFSSSRSDGLSLVAGSDTTNSCSSFPCAEAQVSSANDFASLSLSIFPSSVKKAQQPETYYTDLLDLKNNGNIARTVNAISISSVNDSSSILGSLSIFFCPVQNNTPSKLICAYFTLNRTSLSGSLLGNGFFPVVIRPGATWYIEAVGFANASSKIHKQISVHIKISAE